MRTKAVYLFRVSYRSDLTQYCNLRKSTNTMLALIILIYSDCHFDDLGGEICFKRERFLTLFEMTVTILFPNRFLQPLPEQQSQANHRHFQHIKSFPAIRCHVNF